MPFIHLTTFIAAPPERVFDLSRHVSLHKQSMARNREEIIAGVRSGLMNKGDSVTWQAKHLFKKRILQVELTEMRRPEYFADEQVKGDFLSYKHEHYFKPVENGTIMIDQVRFETPHGMLGRMFNTLYLTSYMTRLITERNNHIKKAAEGTAWKQYLSA